MGTPALTSVRQAGLTGIVLLLAPGGAVAQGYHLRLDTRIQSVSFRGWALDSVAVTDTVTGPSGGPPSPCSTTTSTGPTSSSPTNPAAPSSATMSRGTGTTPTNRNDEPGTGTMNQEPEPCTLNHEPRTDPI